MSVPFQQLMYQRTLAKCNRYRNNALGILSLGLSIGFTYGTFYFHYRNLKQHELIERIKNQVANQSTLQLSDQKHAEYPWVENVRNWEYKAVTLKGYFKDEKFFVRRSKNGQDGFNVYQEFVTAKRSFDHMPNEENPPLETSVFVKLGWVALDKKKEIVQGSDDIPRIELDDKTPFNFTTGFNMNAQEQDEAYPWVEISGLVRKPETSREYNCNFNSEGSYNYLDLIYWSHLLRTQQKNVVQSAFLERIVEERDEESVPVVSTKDDFELPPQTSYSSYRGWTGAAAVGFLSAALSLLRK